MGFAMTPTPNREIPAGAVSLDPRKPAGTMKRRTIDDRRPAVAMRERRKLKRVQEFVRNNFYEDPIAEEEERDVWSGLEARLDYFLSVARKIEKGAATARADLRVMALAVDRMRAVIDEYGPLMLRNSKTCYVDGKDDDRVDAFALARRIREARSAGQAHGAAVASQRMTCGHPVLCKRHEPVNGIYCGWCADIAAAKAEGEALARAVALHVLAAGGYDGNDPLHMVLAVHGQIVDEAIRAVRAVRGRAQEGK